MRCGRDLSVYGKGDCQDVVGWAGLISPILTRWPKERSRRIHAANQRTGNFPNKKGISRIRNRKGNCFRSTDGEFADRVLSASDC